MSSATAPGDSGGAAPAGCQAPGPRVHDGHEDHGHAGHDHSVSSEADARYLGITLALIVGFMAVEVVVGLTSGSLALLADAGHMLTDAAAVLAALWVVHLVRRPPTRTLTFGYQRAEVLSAAANGGTLVVVTLVVTIEAVRRLLHPSGVGGAALIATALAGVVVNLAATLTLTRANRRSPNIAGAFAHLLTDLYAFGATLVAGVVIAVTGWDRADAVASLVTATLMARTAWVLLRSSGQVLLEGTPERFDLEEVRTHLLALPQVAGVHDLHAWVVTADLPAVSAHVVVADECFAAGGAPRLLDHLQACLAGHFDVGHSTFQLEAVGHAGHESGHHD